MDGLLYPASLILLVVLAFVFNRNNNMILLFIVVAIGVYVVYSHETGDSATDWKNEMVESVDKSVGNYNSERGISKYNEDKLKENIK
jgi:hypothetical protein